MVRIVKINRPGRESRTFIDDGRWFNGNVPIFDLDVKHDTGTGLWIINFCIGKYIDTASVIDRKDVEELYEKASDESRKKYFVIKERRKYFLFGPKIKRILRRRGMPRYIEGRKIKCVALETTTYQYIEIDEVCFE